MKNPKFDSESLLEIAEKAALSAGERLRKDADQLRVVNLEERRDVKLQADLESEKLIREHLEASSPFRMIGEEGGGDENLTEGEEYFWIVDPLDGTYNYLRDIPQTCVSIGLLKGLEPILGTVYDFNRKEFFSGIVGKGFYLNHSRCHPVWEERMEKAALATGFPAGRDYSTAALERYIARVQGFKKIRQNGSAALSMAYVAAARFDAYFEEGIRLWDIGAGLALVQAAGGYTRLERVEGPPLTFNAWAAGREEFIP